MIGTVLTEPVVIMHAVEDVRVFDGIRKTTVNHLVDGKCVQVSLVVDGRVASYGI